MEDDLGLGGSELALEPARFADVAEDVVEEPERLRISRAPVRDQRSLVPVDERDPLRAEPAEEGGERAADRAAPAGEEDPAPAEPLLKLEHGWDGIASLEHLLPVERVDRHTAASWLSFRWRQRERGLNRAVWAPHLEREDRIRLIDLRDDEGHQLLKPPHDGVEVELARVVRETLAEQPVCVRDMSNLGMRAELLHVAAELELLVPGVREQAWVDGRERPEQRRVGCVDREPELRYPLAPVQEVAPVAADGGEEDPAGPHPQHGRHVLDQRRDPLGETGRRVEAEELFDRVRVDRAGGAELVGRERNEEVDRQHGGADLCRELHAPLDPTPCFVVQTVDADECAARPGDGRLGRYGQLMVVYTYITHRPNGPVEGVLAGHVTGHQRDLEPSPVTPVEPVGELTRVRR